MSEVKWIKLSVDIFDDEKIEAIGTLPDGNMIHLFGSNCYVSPESATRAACSW